MNTNIEALITARDDLLTAIVSMAEQDNRFLAAWLAGSFGRGEHDAFSDLDLAIVVDDTTAEVLCQRTTMVHANATPERLTLFERFGEILSVHENHYNAPPSATFSNVVYRPSGLIVDWILIPSAQASRPVATQLLFDKVGIPSSGPLPAIQPVERVDRLSERVAFYWLLIFPTAKALLRGDAVQFQSSLEFVARTRLDVEQLLANQRPGYRRDSITQLLTTDAERLDALREETRRMVALDSTIEAAGGSVPQNPREVLETVLQLAGIMD